MFIRSAYNYDRRQASLDAGTVNDEESMTQQQFKDETDINELVRRFGLGYAMPQPLRMPEYGDFTGLDNYHDAANAIIAAGETFDLLPAKVRERFANDPGRFVGFMLDESNKDEAVKLGLLQPRTPVTAVSVAVAEAAVKAANSTPPASGTPPSA